MKVMKLADMNLRHSQACLASYQFPIHWELSIATLTYSIIFLKYEMPFIPMYFNMMGKSWSGPYALELFIPFIASCFKVTYLSDGTSELLSTERLGCRESCLSNFLAHSLSLLDDFRYRLSMDWWWSRLWLLIIHWRWKL